MYYTLQCTLYLPFMYYTLQCTLYLPFMYYTLQGTLYLPFMYYTLQCTLYLPFMYYTFECPRYTSYLHWTANSNSSLDHLALFLLFCWKSTSNQHRIYFLEDTRKMLITCARAQDQAVKVTIAQAHIIYIKCTEINV